MIIAPSILSADFGNLQEDIKRVKSTKWLHVDIMDGHFVPNISLGPVVVKGLKGVTNQILDTHLMITDPLKYAEAFIKAGSDYITFHIEAVDNPLEVINEIRKLGAKPGVSIKPNTKVDAIKEYLSLIDQVLVMSVEPGFGGQQFMPSAVDKIKELDSLRKTHNYSYVISVDGGINAETAVFCKDAGVDVLVAGSYIFNSEDAEERINSLR